MPTQSAAACAPQTTVYKFSEPEQDAPPGITVEFRLIYTGSLPAASASSTRAREKQLIRKQLHRQLRVLWNDHPALRFRLETRPPEEQSEADRIGDEFARCGYRFVPLIRKGNALACSLEILFLRRDNPGGLIRSGGDIDNRLKVLLDGLRMPDSKGELGGFEAEPDEDPFFCLLEDDVLINDLRVTTDRLLSPKGEAEHIHDVMLVIHVTTKVIAWQGLMSYGF